MSTQDSHMQDIIISGVSARLPQCPDIQQYSLNILKGINQDETRSWSKSQSSHLDATELAFPGIDCKQLNEMDANSKMVAACVYEACFDAGINPATLKDTKTGLFIGTCDVKASELVDAGGVGMQHVKSSGNGNQVSKDVVSLFKLKGPIEVIENQLCSSILQMENARKAIASGKCDKAIICGLDQLSQHNNTQSSQQIGCLLIQKAQDCKRSYTKLLNIKVNKSLKEVCVECRVDPSSLAVIDNYATKRDRSDVQSLEGILGSGISRGLVRSCEEPIMSGVEAVVRMVVMVHGGVLPDSKGVKLGDGYVALNAVCGRDNVCLLLQPNTARIEKFSFWNCSKTIAHLPRLFTCSTSSHQATEQLLLKAAQQHPITVDLPTQCLLESALNSSLPTKKHKTTPSENNLKRGFCILNGNQNQPIIQEIKETQGARPPVYYIFSGMATQWRASCKELMQITAFNESVKKSADILCGEGFNDLLTILQTDQSETKSDNQKKTVVDSFVAITAVQIALVDCLAESGLEADGLIGHSIGELACAYADKALSHEETILCAYKRGRTIEEANLPESSMVRVGMSWDEVQKKCPEGVFPACNDHSESVVVCGNIASINAFVTKLKQEGVLTEDVADLALHSHFMTMIASQLKKAMEAVIQRPGMRTSRWISTSLPEWKWKSEMAESASAGYMLNNMCSHVLFKEALELVPKNALCIQIGPSEVLKSILHKSLPQSTHVSLIDHTCRLGTHNQLTHFWTQLGNIHLQGHDLHTINLLVPKQLKASLYPVPVNTAFISDFAKLAYQTPQALQSNKTRVRRSINPEQRWDLESQKIGGRSADNQKHFVVDVNRPEYRFLLGHQINGKCVLPSSALVYMVWNTFAQMKHCRSVSEVNVVLRDLQFHSEIELVGGSKVELNVKIDGRSGEFEVVNCNGGQVVCNGRIEKGTGEEVNSGNVLDEDSKWQCMHMDDVYKRLENKGHQLSGEFRSIDSMNSEETCGQIWWTCGKWIAFLDGFTASMAFFSCAMMQMNVLNSPPHSLQLGELNIKSITINPACMMTTNSQKQDHPGSPKCKEDDSFEKMPTQQRLEVNWNPATSTVNCGGVEICEPVCSKTNPNQNYGVDQQSEHTRLEFVAYMKDSLCKTLESLMWKDGKPQGNVSKYLMGCKELCQVILDRIENERTNSKKMTECSKEIISREAPGQLMQLLKAAALSLPQSRNYDTACRHLFLNKCALFRAIQEDHILNTLPYATNLKALIDTVLENTIQTNPDRPRLRVLEISSSLNKFYGLKLSQIMQQDYPHVNVDYKFASILHNSNQAEIQAYLSEKMSFPVEMVEWDLLKEGGGGLNMQVPSELKDFDLVVFNTCLSSIRSYVHVSGGELKEWLGECVAKTMKARGFMLVHEFTRNLESMQVLAELEHVLQLKKPTNTPFIKDSLNTHWQETNVSGWQQTIEDLNFFPVSLKSDHCLSTLMLYRNQCSLHPMIPTNPSHGIKFLTSMTFLNIDESNWPEACKHILVSPGVKRLILVSEQRPSAKVLEQIGQLRREDENGWKLRCVFTCDKSPISVGCLLATVEERRKFEAAENNGIVPFGNVLMAQVMKADLFMNVFCEGKWGSMHARTGHGGQIEEEIISNHQSEQIKYLMPNECITKFNNIAELHNNRTVTPLVLIHPIEGHVNMLKDLSKMLKCPVYGVQCTVEATRCKSIEELASFYWKKVQAVVGGDRQVHLAGLGFGGAVALEMAGLKQDKCASLTFLDSGKPYFRSNGVKDMAQIDVMSLFTFAHNYLPEAKENKVEHLNQLIKCTTLQQKIDFTVDTLMCNSKFHFDVKDLTEATCAFVQRSHMLEEYEETAAVGKIRVSKYMLLKATTQRTALEELVGRFVRSPEIHVVKCDQRNMLEGVNCAKIAGIMNDLLCEEDKKKRESYDDESMGKLRNW